MEFPSLQHHFTMVVAGPTQSGKLCFVRDLLNLKALMFNPSIDRVIWFYGINQPLYDNIENVEFVEGFPSNYKEYLSRNTLFITDDLMAECGNDPCLTQLFAKADLFNMIFTNRKPSTIIAKEEFLQALQELNIPRHYIKNKYLKTPFVKQEMQAVPVKRKQYVKPVVKRNRIEEKPNCTRAFDDGPRYFEPWSSDVMTPELAPLSPNYHTTPTVKRFNSQQI
ncbi:uncharacterized protein TNCV_3980241 [Trichonephila clavipes]|nr:uncharacterized protein TNCV_3980241 [Trichonephila clavipes]